MQSEQPLKPANILNIVATNQGKRPLTTHIPKAEPLTAHTVQEQRQIGVSIIDTRSSASYGAGHIPGAINIQIASGEFEQRVGWMIPDNNKIILVTGKDEEAQAAIYKLAFVALDRQVLGYLKGGFTAWLNAGQLVATVQQMDVHTLHNRLSTNGLQVIDVRSKDEWHDFHIETAHFLPYTNMVQQLEQPSQLPTLNLTTDQKIAVTCATGKRSSTAISIMRQNGFQHLYNVTGGMEAWKSAKLPMVDGQGNICKF
ncbi:MAG: rhodanese-like domain-containing protein [Chloroflexota bacterium]